MIKKNQSTTTVNKPEPVKRRNFFIVVSIVFLGIVFILIIITIVRFSKEKNFNSFEEKTVTKKNLEVSNKKPTVEGQTTVEDQNLTRDEMHYRSFFKVADLPLKPKVEMEKERFDNFFLSLKKEKDLLLEKIFSPPLTLKKINCRHFIKEERKTEFIHFFTRRNLEDFPYSRFNPHWLISFLYSVSLKNNFPENLLSVLKITKISPVGTFQKKNISFSEEDSIKKFFRSFHYSIALTVFKEYLQLEETDLELEKDIKMVFIQTNKRVSVFFDDVSKTLLTKKYKCFKERKIFREYFLKELASVLDFGQKPVIIIIDYNYQEEKTNQKLDENLLNLRRMKFEKIYYIREEEATATDHIRMIDDNEDAIVFFKITFPEDKELKRPFKKNVFLFPNELFFPELA